MSAIECGDLADNVSKIRTQIPAVAQRYTRRAGQRLASTCPLRGPMYLFRGGSGAF